MTRPPKLTTAPSDLPTATGCAECDAGNAPIINVSGRWHNDEQSGVGPCTSGGKE